MSSDTGQPPVASPEKRTHVRVWICVLIVFLSTVAYADRSILSISGSGIKEEFGLTTVQLGFILSAFSWAYVVGQIPGGIILDRFGTKIVYGAALTIWSVATFAIGFTGAFVRVAAEAVALLFALRFILGFVESPVMPANARIAVMWFPKLERGRVTALFTSSSYFAVGIFSPISGWLVSRFGWPWPFFFLGAIGVISAVVWFWFMHVPRHHPKVSQAEIDHIVANGALIDIDKREDLATKPHISLALVKSLLTRRMLLCTYFGHYAAIALSYFFITWFPIYLVQARHMDIMSAGFATVAPSLAGLAGGVSGGWISDILLKRGWSVTNARKVPYIVGMFAASTIILAAFVDQNWQVIALISFAYFAKGLAAGAGTWVVITDTAPKEAIGLSGSVFNCIGNLAGIMTPIIFGYIVAATGGNYGAGLYFVGGHCIVAALLYLFVMGKIERIGSEDIAPVSPKPAVA